MASMAAQLLFNKNEQTEQKVKAEQQPNIAPATEEQVKNAIVEIVKCLDGELPLGAKAVAYINKANLPVAALPIETVQQVLLAAAMQEASIQEDENDMPQLVSQQEKVAAVKQKKKKKKKKADTGPVTYPELYDRVRDAEGYYGQVQYIGPVCTAKNPYFNYVGVEWDVAGRGKHDGAVKTERGYERYFDCEMGKGSFVKPNKLIQCETFLNAMRNRYDHGGQEEEVISKVDTLKGKTKPITLVGMDKVAAWHKLDTIHQVSLEGFNVGKAYGKNEEAGVVAAQCPRVSELNLRKTMFGNWDDVAKLGKELKRLKILHLSANRFNILKYPLPQDHKIFDSFKALKVLILTNTNMTWGQVCSIDTAIPQLEELHLNKNNLSDFDLPMTTYASWSVNQGDRTRDARGAAGKPVIGFEKLKKLNLSENRFNDWRQIWRLGWLPSLETLLINNNELECVDYLGEEFLRRKGAEAASYRVVYDEDVLKANKQKEMDGEASQKEHEEKDVDPKQVTENTGTASANHGSKPQDFQEYILKQKNNAVAKDHTEDEKKELDRFKGTPFKNLKAISLDHNKIDSWKSFDALNEFVALDYVRFQHNPLSAKTSGNLMRQTAISRVGKLKTYNGSEVRFYERQDAEKLYVKRILLEHQNEEFTVTIESLIPKLRDEHPRLEGLFKQYGEPVGKVTKKNGKSGGMASSMMKIALMSNVPASCTVPVKQMRVPETMTIGALKLICQRRFKLDASSQALFYRDNTTQGHPLELDDDTKGVGFYGVKSGGEILMEELNDDRRKEAEKTKQMNAEAAAIAAEEAQAILLAAKKAGMNGQKEAVKKAADAVPFVSKFR